MSKQSRLGLEMRKNGPKVSYTILISFFYATHNWYFEFLKGNTLDDFSCHGLFMGSSEYFESCSFHGCKFVLWNDSYKVYYNKYKYNFMKNTTYSVSFLPCWIPLFGLTKGKFFYPASLDPQFPSSSFGTIQWSCSASQSSLES